MLSQDQLDRFAREGYLVIEDVLDAATLQAIRDEYADLIKDLHADWAARGAVAPATGEMDMWARLDAMVRAGVEWYQPLDISLPHADISEATPMHIGPAVFDMATHHGILDIAESVIGPELTSNPIQHVRIKPPERAVRGGENRAHIVSTDWHQDRGVTLESADETEMVTIWVAITDATVENGCLQVKPGAEAEMIPHCTLTQTGITERHLPKRASVPTPVRAGGVVVFHPLTPHASLSNHSGGYRWSFDLRYHVTGQNSGREQFPSFVARSRAAPDSVLTDWRDWRDMWSEARRTLAHAPHIPQHRWPSDGPYCA